MAGEAPSQGGKDEAGTGARERDTSAVVGRGSAKRPVTARGRGVDVPSSTVPAGVDAGGFPPPQAARRTAASVARKSVRLFGRPSPLHTASLPALMALVDPGRSPAP